MVSFNKTVYLDVSDLLLLLPVPDRQHVVIGVVHSAEEGATVLKLRTLE